MNPFFMLQKYGSLTIVLAITIILYISTLSYPMTDDSLSFARITEDFISGSIVEDYQRLPALPFFSVPLTLAIGSSTLGVRITSFIFGIIYSLMFRVVVVIPRYL